MLIKIAQDWPLKGTMSFRTNPTVKTRIVFCQDESTCFPTLLKTIAGTLNGMLLRAIK